MSRDSQQPTMAQRLDQTTIGGARRLTGAITISEYDPHWPQDFAWHRERIAGVLGDRALMIEHVGSTSVPGLAAKPKIDILLIVPDSGQETDYVPALEGAGYVLRIREPEWYEHRVMVRDDREVNVHIFSPGCVEIDRMIGFRDWLRAHPDDMQRYLDTKRSLAAQDWEFMQEYADAKSEVVEAIIAIALASKERSADARSAFPLNERSSVDGE